MKPIKFDLPLNGIRIGTLEQLQINLSAEILEPFRSGKLTKWLRVRHLTEQADSVEALLAANNDHEVSVLKSLCSLFGGETDEALLRAAIAERKTVLQVPQLIDDKRFYSPNDAVYSRILRLFMEKENNDALEIIKSIDNHFAELADPNNTKGFYSRAIDVFLLIAKADKEDIAILLMVKEKIDEILVELTNPYNTKGFYSRFLELFIEFGEKFCAGIDMGIMLDVKNKFDSRINELEKLGDSELLAAFEALVKNSKKTT